MIPADGGEAVPIAESGSGEPGAVATSAPPVGKGGRVTQTLVTLRVTHFARFLGLGHSRARIIQNVAALQREEAAKRRAYRDAGASEDEAITEVPIVWGDEPMQTRTLDDYIKRAKKFIASDARALAPQREFVAGKVMLQLDELYAAAFAKKAFHVCHDVVETTIRLFGVEDTVKMILAHSERRGQDGSGDEQTKDSSHLFKTDATKVRKLSDLMRTALQNNPELAALMERRGFVTASHDSTIPDDAPSHNGNGNGNGQH